MVAEIAMRSVFALNPFFLDYNKGSLFNRYFDIVIVQKNLPNLLVSGFTIILQAGVGFVLVSLYHPLFLGFNIVIVVLIWLIWLIWGPRAMKSAVEVSHKKHAAAAWIEGLGASNGFFKSERHIVEAFDRTDAVAGEYMAAHEKHFRHHFAQTLCCLILYAAASATLLGLGGWLVIQGELTLGQLVAAELVLSVVFFGISQLGIYLAYFYELCGSLEELSQFYDVEQEEPRRNAEPFQGNGSLDFVNARGTAATLTFAIPAGARMLCVTETHGLQAEVTNFLKRQHRPTGGYVALGGQDILGIQAHELRQHIIVLDRPNAIEMTIREYLHLSSDGASPDRILETLTEAGLEPTIGRLEAGLDTRIAPTGWPLTITECMQLNLAAALIARPQVLVLGKLYDTLPHRVLKHFMDVMQRECGATIVYFSNRSRDLGFDSYLYMNAQKQQLFASWDELLRHTGGEFSEASTELDASTNPELLPAS
jgi:putative ABC transport system ATP-binding protein